MTKYNGYENRETYDVILHITNDQGLYHMFRNAERSALKEQFDCWFSDLIECPGNLNRELRSMLVDIGSAWRVAWHEVEEALADETDEEETES